MGFVELFLTAVGLSMDAFAVALCKGLGMKKFKTGQAMVIAVFFGGFQALMPLAGWLMGIRFQKYIVRVDHWIAFVLLGILGGKMIYEAMKADEEAVCPGGKTDYKELFLLAVATSIDALAVGITFAFLRVSILSSVSLIGITTFVISIAGVYIGNRFGAVFKKKAEFAGGFILILIGCKILLEHTGIITF